MTLNAPVKPPMLTRRRVLASLGVIAVGAVVAGELDLQLGADSPPSTGSASPDTSGSLLPTGPAPAAAAASQPPGARRTFRSRPDIAAPLIEVTTLAGITSPGCTFLTPANGAGHDGPMIVDAAGELVWMRPGTGKAAADLRVASLDGAPVLTWWEGDNNAGIGAGEHIVVDASYREVGRIPGQNGRAADLHELRLTSRRTAIFFAYASVGPGTVAGSAAPVPKTLDCAIQEVDIATGAVVFEWHSTDHVDVAESYVGAPTTPNSLYDYFHGNSIEEDTDGNLIVSARNTSTVYKIERPSGRILWRLGGRRSDFAMGPGATFGFQHDARRQPDGTLTIFDDRQTPGASRGIVLRLDETAMTATLVREYAQPQALYSTSQGNMQVLPGGHVLIGWGSTPRFSEFTYDGRLVLDAGFTATQSYRDTRSPWVATPAQAPDIALDMGESGVVVYASWNGATEVASWDVLAGHGQSVTRKVASVPRHGFETVIGVTGLQPSDTIVAARARDAAGRVLATSAPAALPG
jgi:hypothetical protein